MNPTGSITVSSGSTAVPCGCDREETAAAGGALIVGAGEEFTLLARNAPAEAIWIMKVGGQAIADGAAFTPPWAE
jgi:hypothetical protein